MDSTKALRFVWFAWNLLGLFNDTIYTWKQTVHLISVFSFVNILSSVAFVTKLFFTTSVKNLLDNLPMNIAINICALKFLTLMTLRKKLITITDYLAALDNRPMNETQRGYLLRAATIIRNLSILIFFCYESVDILAGIEAAASPYRRLSYEIWVPYDFKATAFRYWITFVLQYCAQFMLVVQAFTNDFAGPTYLIVLEAHLRVLLERIRNLSSAGSNAGVENHKELIDCIEDHRTIIRIYDILQETVAYTAFIQFVATILVIFVILLNYLLYPTSLVGTFFVGVFLLAEVLQVLPSCYFSHKFTLTTNELVTAMFSSNWIDQSKEFKKCMIIFMQMTQQPKVINAGKVIPVNLYTFGLIMRISYSLFSLANRLRK